jgi:hypothetical protein
VENKGGRRASGCGQGGQAEIETRGGTVTCRVTEGPRKVSVRQHGLFGPGSMRSEEREEWAGRLARAKVNGKRGTEVSCDMWGYPKWGITRRTEERREGTLDRS